MSAESQPITSHHTQLEWLVGELQRHLSSPGAPGVGESSVIAWYMSYGYSRGLSRAELEASLAFAPHLRSIAAGLSDDEISNGKPPPSFVEGQLVEVVLNARNTTYHKGIVQEIGWHHEEAKWLFRLSENGKRVSKRYEAEDLRAAGS